MFGLARLAIAGFAPGGHLPVLALAACAVGLAATLFTGRAPGSRGQAAGQGRTTVLADGADVRCRGTGHLGRCGAEVARGGPGRFCRYRPDQAVVGLGMAARRGGAGDRRRPGAPQHGRAVPGGVQSPVPPRPDGVPSCAAGLAARARHARTVPDPTVRCGDARDRDDRGGPGILRLRRDRHRGRLGLGGRALAAGLPEGEDLPGRRHQEGSKTAPSPSRPPIRCRSRRSPSTPPAGSGRRGEPQSMPVRRARLPQARCRPAA
jgi:hypothetical protein